MKKLNLKWIIGLMIISCSAVADFTLIASDGDTLTSTISSEASRCSFYVFLDDNGNVLEIMQNPHQDVKGGASSNLVKMIKDKKVSHLIASNFGDKLIGHLESNGIKYTVHKGDVNSVVQRLKK